MAEMLDLDLVASTAEVENLLIATLDKQVLTDAGQFLREICDDLIEPFPIVVRDEHHGVETTAIVLLPFGLGGSVMVTGTPVGVDFMPARK
jgi:hypothetical protein